MSEENQKFMLRRNIGKTFQIEISTTDIGRGLQQLDEAEQEIQRSLRPLPSAPPGLDFSEFAKRVQEQMTANRMTQAIVSKEVVITPAQAPRAGGASH